MGKKISVIDLENIKEIDNKYIYCCKDKTITIYEFNSKQEVYKCTLNYNIGPIRADNNMIGIVNLTDNLIEIYKLTL